jgi:hypothetical protein
MNAQRGLLQQQELEQRAAAQREDAAWKQFQMEQARAKMEQQQQPDLSKTPTYIRGPDGSLKIIQLSATGQPTQTQLPPGYEPLRPVTWQDFGGHKGAVPYGATAPSQVYGKTLPPEAMPETRAAQTTAVEQAKTRQKAVEELPGAELSANRTLRYVNELKENRF